MSVQVPQSSPASRPVIAIFLPSLEGGGAERVFATLANGFVRHGHRVDLVLARAVGPYLASLDPRVNIVDLGARSISSSIFPLIRYFGSAKPVAILSALSHANVVALIAHWLTGSRATIVVSERLSLNAARQFHRSFKDRLVRLGMRLTYRRASRIVVVASQMIYELSHYLRLPDDRLKVIYNPVVTDALIAAAGEPVAHRWLPVHETPVILGCGRLSAQKDFPTLLQAIADIRKRRAVRVIILGEGEDRTALASLAEGLGIADDLDMPGFVANPFSFMRHASLFVLSSQYEGMPGALIQALACGAKVVSTDCPTGPDEILEQGRWGHLVPVGDVSAMAAAIENVLESRAPKDSAKRARAFSEAEAVAEYLECLNLPLDQAFSRSSI